MPNTILQRTRCRAPLKITFGLKDMKESILISLIGTGLLLCGCQASTNLIDRTELPAAGCVVTNTAPPHTLYYVTIRPASGDLYVSTDGGRHWLHRGTTPGAVSDLLIHSETKHLFAIFRQRVDHRERCKVVVTSDDGLTWNNISGPTEYFDGGAIHLFLDPVYTTRICVEGASGVRSAGWQAVDSAYSRWVRFSQQEWNFNKHGPLVDFPIDPASENLSDPDYTSF